MSITVTLHLLAAVLWVGGMFFAHQMLRPVAATLLEPPLRQQLWVGVFGRFFPVVWGAIATIVATVVTTIVTVIAAAVVVAVVAVIIVVVAPVIVAVIIVVIIVVIVAAVFVFALVIVLVNIFALAAVNIIGLATRNADQRCIPTVNPFR